MELIYATGFNGWLPSMDCGTSFAAPRVAWFLAASEVVRREALDIRSYGSILLERLRAMRRQWTDDSRARLLFSPRILLGLPANP